jgi:hypothetical protein
VFKNTNIQLFDKVKENISAKYKNLPAKFHQYLDEVIKMKLNELK